MSNYKRFTIIISGFVFSLLLHTAAVAQEANAVKDATDNNSESWMYFGIATILIFLLFFMVMVLKRVKGLTKDDPLEKISFGQWWATVNQKIFTKAVPVENEEGILLDHEYDGIRELDNSLPPWWKYGFYITVFVAVIYMLRFHVWKTGPTPEQEYNKEMQIAAAQLEELRKNSHEMVDEKTVTMADAAGIEEGKKIFTVTCYPCHGGHGEGGVGPNLTDNYWLHGGSINEVFSSIKYGWPDKGMQAWEKQFSPTELKNLASFVKSLKGSNPANAKPPQGDLYVEKAKEDSSTTPAKNSITKK